MDATQDTLKKPAKIALIALGILLIGAVVFYKERLFFADAAFIVFNVINHNSFYIQEQRFGSFITQVIPYICENIHLPLKVILIGYSISFNIFYLSVAALLVYWLRQYKLAILMSLYYFLFVSQSYFWTNNEIHQAIAWMFLFFGVIIYMGEKGIKKIFIIIPFILLAFITISTHFVVIIPMLFLWVYFWIEKENWQFSKTISILFTSLLLIIIYLKYALTTAGSYDAQHLHGVTHFSLKDILDSFTTSAVNMFIYRCFTNYWLGVIVFIFSLFILVKKKKYKALLWVLISCIGYFIIMGITYNNLDNNTLLFHIESEWASICIIVATPFVFEFLPSLKPSVASWLLIVIFIVRLGYICTAIPLFCWRTEFKEKIMAQMKKKGIKKLAIYRDSYLQSKLMLDWGITYESLMTSAENGDKPQLTFFFLNKDDKKTQEAIKNPKSYFNAFDIMPVSNLNYNYFVIDTTHPYQIMSYEELFK